MDQQYSDINRYKKPVASETDWYSVKDHRYKSTYLELIPHLFDTKFEKILKT